MASNTPHILITSGPTAVAIDQMRVITNRSTGEMGRLLANALARKYPHISLLEGQGATTDIPLSCGVAVKKFFLYDELAALIRRELSRPCRIIIHAAAVSDFALKHPVKGKIASGKALMLQLYPTKKIINDIRILAPESFLVGFKLETTLAKRFILDKTRGLFKEAGCDMVVANTLKNGEYAARLINNAGGFSSRFDSKEALVEALSGKVDEVLG